MEMKFLMKKFKKKLSTYQNIFIYLGIVKDDYKNNDRTTQKIRISTKET